MIRIIRICFSLWNAELILRKYQLYDEYCFLSFVYCLHQKNVKQSGTFDKIKIFVLAGNLFQYVFIRSKSHRKYLLTFRFYCAWGAMAQTKNTYHHTQIGCCLCRQTIHNLRTDLLWTIRFKSFGFLFGPTSSRHKFEGNDNKIIGSINFYSD